MSRKLFHGLPQVWTENYTPPPCVKGKIGNWLDLRDVPCPMKIQHERAFDLESEMSRG